MRTDSFAGSQHRAERGGLTGEGSAAPPANIGGEDRERIDQQLNNLTYWNQACPKCFLSMY